MLGLDELLAHLDATAAFFEGGSDLLAGTRRLVVRARADFVIAVDATLAGQLSVVSDAMRDVLEIEMLMLDFMRTTLYEHLGHLPPLDGIDRGKIDELAAYGERPPASCRAEFSPRQSSYLANAAPALVGASAGS